MSKTLFVQKPLSGASEKGRQESLGLQLADDVNSTLEGVE